MNRSERAGPGLFARIMLAFLVVVVVGGLLAFWLARQATAQQFQIYTREVDQRQAAWLAPLLVDYYQSQGGWQGVAAYLEASQSRPGIMNGQGMGGHMGQGMMGNQSMWQMMGSRVLVADAAGRVVADTGQELVGTELDPAALSSGVPLEAGTSSIGTVLVTAGLVTAGADEAFLAGVDRAIFLSVMAAGLLSLLFGGLVAWQVVRPLRRLTAASRAIAAGQLEQHVPVSSGDEVGELAQAFNQMAERLARSEALRRRMTADIAHELRTPLTVIQGNVEALQDGIFPLTPEALTPIHERTVLLQRLVEDLRQLTLADADQLPLERQPVHLDSLAERVVDGFRPVAESEEIGLQLEAIGVPAVNADPGRIEQVLANLVANALHHTPAGGIVTVSVRRHDAAVYVSVADTGPGIPEEALPHVFERFYRVDTGRGRGADGSGSGLGLAVARSLVQAHGGQIGVENRPEGGARVWFSLPLEATLAGTAPS